MQCHQNTSCFSLVSSSSSIKRDVTLDVMPDVPQKSILQFALDFNKIAVFLSVVLYELLFLSNVFISLYALKTSLS